MPRKPAADVEVYFQFFTEIGIINQLATAGFQKTLGGRLSQSEFGVLNHFVRTSDGRSLSQLATIMQVTRPSMSAIVDKLLRKGCVRLETDPEDGRSKRVYLTDRGRELRLDCIRAAEPWGEELAGLLDVKVIGDLLPSLKVVRETLDEARNKPY